MRGFSNALIIVMKPKAK